MEELPVATVRPRHLLGRIAAARGAFGRWLRAKMRRAIEGRHAPLLLTGVFFSGMMLAMGYVADRAQRAADAIDEAHREAAARRRAAEAELPAPAVSEAPTDTYDYEADEAPELPSPHRAAALFYIRATTR
jgi:hypothetical protein